MFLCSGTSEISHQTLIYFRPASVLVVDFQFEIAFAVDEDFVEAVGAVPAGESAADRQTLIVGSIDFEGATAAQIDAGFDSMFLWIDFGVKRFALRDGADGNAVHQN